MPKRRGICCIPNCPEPHYGKGWCRSHHDRWKRHGDPLGGRPRRSHVRGLPCEADDCELPSSNRGLCPKHYAKLRRHGDPNYVDPHRGNDKIQRLPRGASPIERVLSKIIIDVVTGCWVWQANKLKKGYGRFGLDDKPKLVHIFIYEYYVGPIPDGYEVDHLCCNKSCCNPDHLEAVPREENQRRWLVLKTDCLRGHAYAEHGFIDSAGRRRCRVCTNEKNRAYKAKKRLERSNQ